MYSPLVLALFICALMGLNASIAVATESANRAQSSDTQAKSTGSEFTLQEKPRWEFGIGGGYLDGFDYPGSKDPNQRTIVLPYFIYRSPRLRVGAGGVNTIAIENPRVKLDWSIAGSLSSASEDNSARAGLPNLDYLFEIGPQLVVNLYDRDVVGVGRIQGQWSGKIRAVFSTDFSSIESQGFVGANTLRLNVRNIRGWPIGFFSSLTSTYAGEEIQDYYYEVAPGFENANRALFDASAGYLGTTLRLALGGNIHRSVRLFAGVNIGVFDGAKNSESPLFETTRSSGFAVGFVWTIKQSQDQIPVLVSNE